MPPAPRWSRRPIPGRSRPTRRSAHPARSPSSRTANTPSGRTPRAFFRCATTSPRCSRSTEQIRCIFAEGPGCYGRSGADDVPLDAAVLARAVPGRPVRVQWMRDDEFVWEPYGTAMAMKARGAVADGRIVDWQYDVWTGPHGLASGQAGGQLPVPELVPRRSAAAGRSPRNARQPGRSQCGAAL